MGLGPALSVLLLAVLTLVSTIALVNTFWRCYSIAVHVLLILYIASGLVVINEISQYGFSLIFLNLLIGVAYITFVIVARLKYLDNQKHCMK